MGNTCIPMADSCQCMAKPPQYCKVIRIQLQEIIFFKNERNKPSELSFILKNIHLFIELCQVLVGACGL